MATQPTRSPTTAMTAEELLRLPAGDRRLELIAGELREMAPAGAEHGAVAAWILTRIASGAATSGAGTVFAAETGFVLSRAPDTVRAPDAAFVTQERVEAAGRVLGYWPGPPDLAVEVVSPGDSFSEVHEKALAWLRAGARVVLVADPPTCHVTVYRSPSDVRVLAGDDPVDCTDLVPGFAPAASTLFP